MLKSDFMRIWNGQQPMSLTPILMILKEQYQPVSIDYSNIFKEKMNKKLKFLWLFLFSRKLSQDKDLIVEALLKSVFSSYMQANNNQLHLLKILWFILKKKVEHLPSQLIQEEIYHGKLFLLMLKKLKDHSIHLK